MITLACDAVEVKAKYQLPGIHPKSTSNRNVTLLFFRIPIPLSDCCITEVRFLSSQNLFEIHRVFVFFVLEF
jgi:hypothetical protein